MGEITSGRVIFGPDNAEPLLGITALESIGIIIDSENKTLKRMPVIRVIPQCLRISGVRPGN